MPCKTLIYTLWIIAAALLSACASTPDSYTSYPNNNLFNKEYARKYYHELPLKGEGQVDLFAQTRSTEERPFFQKTLTILAIDGERLLPEPFPSKKAIWPNVKEGERKVFCSDNFSESLCQLVVERQTLMDNMFNSSEQFGKGRHNIRGQQSVIFRPGTRKITLLLFGYSSMGRGDIGVYEADAIDFSKGDYTAHFEVEGNTVGNRHVRIWILEENTGDIVWEVKDQT
ncbi:hypothetical protein [Gilvimarinus algae]|uniref:Lipoprotein n=1 Tax=Gilvimarinus algae TaxID=3058037 RepID=A0ABT8TED9_9GAMM|nr:hypothetical protein [Gilvimarinus sp. SDUM040014]MDO3382457.1 hypothetical protein [Gilvimarinus sp. SDUM040014]